MLKSSRKAGLSPGTLIHIGERKEEDMRIKLMDYDKDSFNEKNITKIEDTFDFKKSPTVTWINIGGLHDVDSIEKMGSHFGIHPLVMEDILNTEQRPKIEDFDDYIFLSLKMLSKGEEGVILYEQISIIIGSNFVISFQEREGDVFDKIRKRIREGKGKIRKSGSDYLAYTLIDAIVDNYFVLMEDLGERIDNIENALLSKPGPETLEDLHSMKREMINIRKSIWPLREVISGFQRTENELITDSTDIFLRDVYDHTIQVIDTIETFRDMISGMVDIYLSSVSNKMNEVMKVLTIIATIFIPLTFIAGIYGMNFSYMPELDWQPGYYVVWSVMIIVAILMIIYFRRKNWL